MHIPKIIPLAERCRPQSVKQYIGQSHLLSEGKIISKMIESKSCFSIILWGEPGTGKTTIAKIIANACDMDTHFLSAISAGVADVRKVIQKGKENKEQGMQTLLFLDEIHRFNKAQQDSVLGAVEAGDIVLIGATTENPSFNVIAPLLSRTRVLRLKPFSDEELLKILENAILQDEILSQQSISLADTEKKLLILAARGDARRMYNIFESALSIAENGIISDIILKEAIQSTLLYYDKSGDNHYDTISAFIKSLRGSDPDASLFYLAAMLQGGEDPVFIARRMVIFASEDIGNAAPQALQLAVATQSAVKNIGMPEAEIILSHCTTFLASAPKSNASYTALHKAKTEVKNITYTIPLHLRNAPTELMKKMGYSKGYQYPHDFENNFVKETYLPNECKNKVFYKPTDQGSEKFIKERLKVLWPEKY